eukprot:GEMP01009245.1.p1 GENE.GEMP01009245.1~~GEMP01009245.1.p1  ORF type:complete len:801 (+),score=238.43 GEMP01009245.1:41-2404(+)
MKYVFLFLASAFAQDAAAPPEAIADKPAAVSDGFNEEQLEAMKTNGEKHEFQAEVSRLMDIIINSLYTERQVFLRELISNSADALEKARFHSVEDKKYLDSKPELEIKVEFDSEAKTVSITDTGVGMTKSDLINNLGTVAKSGTTNFLEAMSNGADANLIGQFGVGFYSAFLVADKIAVTSKHNDDKQHIWESSADASFTVVEDPRGNTLGRGSRVTLHLKEDAHEYLSESKIKDTILKYSKFVTFPIYNKVKKEVEEEADDDDEEEKDAEDEDEEDSTPEKKEKTYVHEWEQVNTQKPIWMRSKDEISEEEYNEFYKSISNDNADPLSYTHFSAEGEIEFRSVLYLPSKAPAEMLTNYYQTKSEIKLYVRRVLVADSFEDLLPRYLNFVRGVIDSDDLPLNVSREQLQQNKIMKVISKKIVRKALEMMKNLAKKNDKSEDDEEDGENKEEKKEDDDDDKDDSKYSAFYKEFSKNLKLGCQEDDTNRSKLSKLLRFTNTKTDEISLDDYVDKMKENQESIYYMSGEDHKIMLNSPNMQIFKKKDLDVLLLTDPLDEGCIQRLADFEGKKFVSIQKSDLKLEETDAEKKRFKKITEMYKPLTKWWKTLLEDFSKTQLKGTVSTGDVEISQRLTESPITVLSSKYGYSAQQEKIMKAQAFQNNRDTVMAGKKTIEINPNHPVIVDLLQKVKDDDQDEKAKRTAELLFQTALIEQGYDLPDPSNLVRRFYALMSGELGVDPEAPLKDIEVPEDEEEEEEEEKADDEKEEKADEDNEGNEEIETGKKHDEL